jgi:hypothetical protein
MPGLHNSRVDRVLRGGPVADIHSIAESARGEPDLLSSHRHERSDDLRHRIRILRQDSAYILLSTLTWLAINLLAVLGSAVALFLVVAGGDLPTFFVHLDNLTSRYVEADLGRRAAFEHQLVQALLLLLLLSLLVRGPLFVARLRRELRAPLPGQTR